MVDLLVIRANIFTPVGSEVKKGLQLSRLNFIERGAIAVENGLIVDAGTTDDLFDRYKDAKRVFDAGGRALLPGFVDPHTHAVFLGTRESEFKMRLEGRNYMEILNAGGGILSTVRKVRGASVYELVDELKKRVRLFFSYGTTTIEVKSGYGLDFENEIKLLKAIKIVKDEGIIDIVPTFMGAHAIPVEFKNNKQGYIDKLLNDMIPFIAENGLAEFIDVFCETGVYTPDETYKILETGVKYGLKAKIHSDEIEAIGCTQLATKVRIYSCDHLLKITGSGLEALKKGKTIATLLPGTAFSLREVFAPAREIIDYGIGVALATDCNPGSSFTESMPEIITIAVLQMGMMPEEAIIASTLNAACALDKQSKIGSIEVGKQADFIILNESSYLFIPYHYGINPVWKTFKRGIDVTPADN